MARQSTTPQLVTRQSLQLMINQAQATNDQQRLADIIGRALVVLFERQTASEQRRNDTENRNDVGFSSNDGKSGCITAKSYLKHRTLQDWQVQEWTREWRGTGYAKICKYARQLNEAAVEKARRQGKII